MSVSVQAGWQSPWPRPCAVGAPMLQLTVVKIESGVRFGLGPLRALGGGPVGSSDAHVWWRRLAKAMGASSFGLEEPTITSELLFQVGMEYWREMEGFMHQIFLAIGLAYEQATEWYRRNPDLSRLE